VKELRAVERARAKVEQADADLEEAIRAARQVGVSYRQIAETAGFSHEWVRKVVAGTIPGRRRRR
jgi:hypothetical protein